MDDFDIENLASSAFEEAMSFGVNRDVFERYIRKTVSESQKEIASLKQQLVEAQKDADSKQARIDELMLEFCPKEMTTEQVIEWAKHQRAVSSEEYASIDQVISTQNTEG